MVFAKDHWNVIFRCTCCFCHLEQKRWGPPGHNGSILGLFLVICFLALSRTKVMMRQSSWEWSPKYKLSLQNTFYASYLKLSKAYSATQNTHKILGRNSIVKALLKACQYIYHVQTNNGKNNCNYSLQNTEKISKRKTANKNISLSLFQYISQKLVILGDLLCPRNHGFPQVLRTWGGGSSKIW